MTIFLNPSLRMRAALALAVTFGVIAALLVWMLATDLQDRFEAANARLLSEVKLIAAREENIVARGDTILNGMSDRRQLDRGAPVSDCEMVLTTRIKRENLFESAAVLEPDGSVRCTSLPAPAWASNPDRAFSRLIREAGTVIVSDAVDGPNGSSILLGKTLRDAEGRVTGLAILSLGTAWLQAESMKGLLPTGARISIIDRSSRVLARYPDQERLAGQRLPESRVIQTVLASPAAKTFQETGITGELLIVGHAPILASARGSQFHILLAVPRRVVAGPTLVKAAESLGILLLVLFSALSALFLGTNRMLLEPLDRLSDASLRLEKGDLSARSGLAHGDDEIGRLAYRLDMTAAAVERRERDLLEKAALLDSANDAIIVRDMSNRITYWNKAAEALYGWTAEEAAGQPLRTLLGADPERFAEGEVTVLETGTWSGEIEKRTKGGRVVTVLGSWTLLRDKAGAPLSILTIDSDITERRIADRHLRESEERFRSLAESISEIFWIINAERSACLYVSPAFEAIMGRKCQELIETPSIWADAIHPDDRTRVLAAADAGQVNGTYNETYRILHADGTVRWLHERAFPVRDADGTVQRIVGTAADVTQRRMIEEQLQQSQKMDAIGRLAGGIAHDFNNLLVVILGYTDILLERRDLDPEVLAALRPISAAADRASALTAQLLGFSRKTILRPQVIDLNAAVRDLGGMLTRLIGEDITFTTVLNKNVDRVTFDPHLLGQVLMNLAVNARDAMPHGGSLTVETVNLYIEDDLVRPDRQPGPYVMLAMTDTGTGMPPEVRERIFEPFFTTKEVGKGTGLGLSMVLGIVQQSGGFIGVYSEPGHGTTFKIFLPSTQSDPPSTKAAAARHDLGGHETILLVEDETAVRDLIQTSLQGLGYTVLTALDGQDALRLLADTHPRIDLILTDVIMPHLSGPNLVALLRPRLPDVKVLFMSGYTDDVVVRHGLLNADVSFIQKPFTRTGLAKRLRTLFSDTR